MSCFLELEINDKSVLNFGDLSVLSFHATKKFNTIEGGAIISHDEKTKKRIDLLKNFGFADEVTVVAPGINAKMNEIQAAFGLLQLKSFELQLIKLKKITDYYKEKLHNIKGIRFLNEIEGIKYNYAYFPIFVDSDKYPLSRDELYFNLRENNIFGRRYFYPLISQFSPYKHLPSANERNLPIAEKTTKEVICLPIYAELELSIIDKITEIIKK